MWVDCVTIGCWPKNFRSRIFEEVSYLVRWYDSWCRNEKHEHQPSIVTQHSKHSLIIHDLTINFFLDSFLILLCCENATQKFRSTMVPIHASLGVATFMLAIGAAITGLTEKALNDLGWDLTFSLSDFYCYLNEILSHYSTNSKDTYSGMVEEGIIINSIAVILIGLGIIVPFAVRRTNSPASFKVGTWLTNQLLIASTYQSIDVMISGVRYRAHMRKREQGRNGEGNNRNHRHRTWRRRWKILNWKLKWTRHDIKIGWYKNFLLCVNHMRVEPFYLDRANKDRFFFSSLR